MQAPPVAPTAVPKAPAPRCVSPLPRRPYTAPIAMWEKMADMAVLNEAKYDAEDLRKLVLKRTHALSSFPM